MDEKQASFSKLFKRLLPNQTAFFIEKIECIEEEIASQNLRQEIKSKKGVLHEIAGNAARPEGAVKIFEKKVAIDEDRRLYLHIGLRRLSYSNFRPRVSEAELEQLLSLPENKYLEPEQLSLKLQPDYSLGDGLVFALSKIPLKDIMEHNLRGSNLDQKVVFFSGLLADKPSVPTLDRIFPYSGLPDSLRLKPYGELIADQSLLEKFYLDEDMYLGPPASNLDPRLNKTLTKFFQAVVEDLDIRWLHFQGLLWDIEKADEEFGRLFPPENKI